MVGVSFLGQRKHGPRVIESRWGKGQQRTEHCAAVRLKSIALERR
jgi:hypothetical protein